MNKVKITREVVVYLTEEVDVKDFLTESARLTEVDQLDELGHFGFTLYELDVKLNRETGYNSITFGGQEHPYCDYEEREAVKNKLIKHMETEHNTGYFGLDNREG